MWERNAFWLSHLSLDEIKNQRCKTQKRCHVACGHLHQFQADSDHDDYHSLCIKCAQKHIISTLEKQKIDTDYSTEYKRINLESPG